MNRRRLTAVKAGVAALAAGIVLVPSAAYAASASCSVGVFRTSCATKAVPVNAEGAVWWDCTIYTSDTVTVWIYNQHNMLIEKRAFTGETAAAIWTSATRVTASTPS